MRAITCLLAALITFGATAPAHAQLNCPPWNPCPYSDPDATLYACSDDPATQIAGSIRPNRVRYAQSEYWMLGGWCFEIDCAQERNTIANLAWYGIDNAIMYQKNGASAYSDQFKNSFWGGTVYPVFPGGEVNDWGTAAGISSVACWIW